MPVKYKRPSVHVFLRQRRGSHISFAFNHFSGTPRPRFVRRHSSVGLAATFESPTTTPLVYKPAVYTRLNAFSGPNRQPQSWLILLVPPERIRTSQRKDQRADGHQNIGRAQAAQVGRLQRGHHHRRQQRPGHRSHRAAWRQVER